MFSMNEKDFDELIGVVENIKDLFMKAKDLNYDHRYDYVLDFLDCKVGNLLNNMKYSKLDLASSRKIKSARFIVEDENGEVIGSADTYEEAETMGGARIIDGEKIQSKRFVKSEKENSRYIILMYDDIGGDGYKPGYYVWDKNDDVFMGDGAGGTFYSSYEEAYNDLNRANSTIEEDGFEARIVKIKSLDEYEELFSSAKIASSAKIVSSEIGDIHDDYVIGNINEDAAFMKLEKLVGMDKAENFIDEWKNKRFVNSSLEKAVSEAEDYFGTIASDDTVMSQDVITYKDGLEMKKIADKNDVKVKIGRYSVTFHNNDFEKFNEMIHRD